MKSVGIREVFVLIGHKGYEIAKMLGNGARYDVSIRYVDQTNPLGIAHAVGRLGDDVDRRPFLLMLDDIFFVPENLGSMFDRFEEQGGGGGSRREARNRRAGRQEELFHRGRREGACVPRD
jgi:dTDP-glucose pyrophosphorylase